jgi:hypothetical protein
MTRDEALISVWRQTLMEDAKAVELEGRRYPVKRTSRHHLRQVDFTCEDEQLRGLEQNPDTNSRWAQMAREGKKVMQFLSKGRYIGVVADGKVIAYSKDYHGPLGRT